MNFSEINLIDYLPSYMIILLVASYVLGAILKSLDCVKDKYITLILGFLDITIAVLLAIINAKYKVALDTIIMGVLQGIIAWGISIGINQTGKQLNKEE